MIHPEETKDRHFNSYRIARSDSLATLIREVIGELEKQEQRQRKRKPKDQAVFEQQVEALICEAAYREFQEPGAWITITRSKQVLGRVNRYQSTAMGKTLPCVMDLLSSPSVALLDVTLGTGGSARVRGPQTAYRASNRLLSMLEPLGISWADFGLHHDEEVIILKAPKQSYRHKAKRLQYAETDQTTNLRQEMREINGWIEEADISYASYAPEVNLLDRRMRRVFNKGSFALGGRMFGGFWQGLHKAERKDIRIGGNQVVVLDFSHVGPRILYGMAGAVPPMDAYAVPGFIDSREGIKKVFAAMTYADAPLQSFPKETKALFPKSSKIGEVTKAIEQHHVGIAHSFYSGVGLEVMNVESQIMVSIVTKLRSQGIVALPIHDAVVVKEDHAQQTLTTMLDAFLNEAGIEGKVELEE